jgi:Integrase zinc binding domain
LICRKYQPQICMICINSHIILLYKMMIFLMMLILCNIRPLLNIKTNKRICSSNLNKHQDGFHLKSFHGGKKNRILYKIVIPRTLQWQVITWYHNMLCHSSETRMEQTLRQQFWWPYLHSNVHDICSKCDTCQRTKRTSKKYGHSPAKEAEADPWEVLCVYLIGPYTIKCRGKKNLVLWCVTMIDPAATVEMQEIPKKEALTVAGLVEQTWLTEYSWPDQITFDRGKEFKGEFARMVEKDYGIKRKHTRRRSL